MEGSEKFSDGIERQLKEIADQNPEGEVFSEDLMEAMTTLELEPLTLNPNFKDIQDIDKKRVSVLSLARELNKLFVSNTAIGMDGQEQDSNAAYLEIAAHFNIFTGNETVADDKQIFVDRVLPTLLNLKTKAEGLQYEKENKEGLEALKSFLKNLYYAKVVHPNSLGNPNAFLKNELLSLVHQKMKECLRQQAVLGFNEFFSYYEFLPRLDQKIAGKALKNSGFTIEDDSGAKSDWQRARVYAETSRTGIAAARKLSMVETVRPRKNNESLVGFVRWRLLVNQSKELFYEKRYRDFLVHARYLKDLKVA